jgi:hypothetical protein
VSLLGCSVAFTNKASRNYDYAAPPRCTSSPALWVVDGVGALAGVSLALVGANGAANDEGANVAAAVGLSIAVAYAISAALVHRWINHCLELQDG